ncbi:MAG: ATP-NAD kinase family protein [Candidatus Korarchaeota archaeon]|nr:ATP-NAD kinase family protein [Candidatus Korarchaeota archaeon]
MGNNYQHYRTHLSRWWGYIGWKRSKIGLIVNPIAGLGGPLGRKGTDDPETVKEALKRGLRKRAIERAARALGLVRDLEGIIYTVKGEMGEISVKLAGLSHRMALIAYEPSRPSTREDTIFSAREMLRLGIDVLVFVGGDGTARDILEAVCHEVVVLGVPSGVKVFSSVFAQTPEDAGRILREYLRGNLDETVGEVVDIPEEEYRKGRFSPKVLGTMRIPKSLLVQGSKSMTPIDEDSLEGIYRYIEPKLSSYDVIVLGPGRTVSYVAKKMGYEKNPSTVDVVVDGRQYRDVDSFLMESLIEGRNRVLVVITPIGGTSFLLGRGNHQLIPAIRRVDWNRDVLIIATPEKIGYVRELVIDVDDGLKGVPEYLRVITGYKEEKIVRLKVPHE